MCSHHFAILKQQAIILPAFSLLQPVVAHLPPVRPRLAPLVPAPQLPQILRFVIPLMAILIMLGFAIQFVPQKHY
jgi:hypothetical protein